MSASKSIATRMIQYLDIHNVTQEEFAEDSKYGKPFDKGRLGKSKSKEASIGSDVIEKFLRRFPRVNPHWLILGIGDIHIEKHSYDEPVKIMPLDGWELLKDNNTELKDSSKVFKMEIERLWGLVNPPPPAIMKDQVKNGN